MDLCGTEEQAISGKPCKWDQFILGLGLLMGFLDNNKTILSITKLIL